MGHLGPVLCASDWEEALKYADGIMERRVNFHYALHGFHAISVRG